MGRARFLSSLPLSLQEKTEVFAIWIEPVVFLTARAYYPTAGVQSQLKLVQRMALGLNSWGITAQILSEVRGRGGLKFASIHTYALWVHSFAFVQFVKDPWSCPERIAGKFTSWAGQVGLDLTEKMLSYTQLAVVPHKGFGFLHWSLIAFSRVRKFMPAPSPPPITDIRDMGIWHNVLFQNEKGHTYVSPDLVRRGVTKWA